MTTKFKSAAFHSFIKGLGLLTRIVITVKTLMQQFYIKIHTQARKGYLRKIKSIKLHKDQIAPDFIYKENTHIEQPTMTLSHSKMHTTWTHSSTQTQNTPPHTPKHTPQHTPHTHTHTPHSTNILFAIHTPTSTDNVTDHAIN